MISKFVKIYSTKLSLLIIIRCKLKLGLLKTTKCWVWFRGNLNGNGHWKEGFTCTFDEKPGILIESPAYVTCRVPNWRVLTTEPEDFSKSPSIPENAVWKLI